MEVKRFKRHLLSQEKEKIQWNGKMRGRKIDNEIREEKTGFSPMWGSRKL